MYITTRPTHYHLTRVIPTAETAISVRNGTFAWGHGPEDTDILKDINVTVPKGSLVAVVGSVGAGKSSLCSALLGDMELRSGSVNVAVRGGKGRGKVEIVTNISSSFSAPLTSL